MHNINDISVDLAWYPSHRFFLRLPTIVFFSINESLYIHLDRILGTFSNIKSKGSYIVQHEIKYPDLNYRVFFFRQSFTNKVAKFESGENTVVDQVEIKNFKQT